MGRLAGLVQLGDLLVELSSKPSPFGELVLRRGRLQVAFRLQNLPAQACLLLPRARLDQRGVCLEGLAVEVMDERSRSSGTRSGRTD